MRRERFSRALSSSKKKEKGKKCCPFLSLSSLSLSLFLVAYLSPSAAQEMIESVPGSSTRSYLFVREW